MLAVVIAESPEGQAWLENVILAGPQRWKKRHRRLLKNRRAEAAPAASTELESFDAVDG